MFPTVQHLSRQSEEHCPKFFSDFIQMFLIMFVSTFSLNATFTQPFVIITDLCSEQGWLQFLRSFPSTVVLWCSATRKDHYCSSLGKKYCSFCLWSAWPSNSFEIISRLISAVGLFGCSKWEDPYIFTDWGDNFNVWKWLGSVLPRHN